MQVRKTILLGALLAGFTGAAAAETSVTLYGLIDSGLIYQRAKVGTTDGARAVHGSGYQSRIGYQGGQQSGSRWGLRGTEDLGNGVAANFVLESGFNSGDGRSEQGRLFNRQATVGLSSAAGSLDLGRQTNVASRYFEAIDPFALDFYAANMGSTFGAANTVRYDNTIMYQSPVFAGFQFAGGYSFAFDTVDEVTNFRTGENNRAATAGLRYIGGPLTVALSYDRQWKKPNQPRPHQAIIGAAYDFEVVKLSAAYGQSRDGVISGPGLPLADGRGDASGEGTSSGAFTWRGLKVHSYMAGVSAPIGATTALFGSYQRADPNEGLTPTNIYSVGTTYALSKRTNFYAYGSYADNHAFIDGNKATTVGVGVRHQF